MEYRVEQQLPGIVEGTLKKLLSEKHLYQSISIDTAFVDDALKETRQEWANAAGTSVSRMPNAKEMKDEGMRVVYRSWMPERTCERPDPFEAQPTKKNHIEFKLPTIHAYCEKCDHYWPFNPMYWGLSCDTDDQSSSTQWYSLSYQCQSCKEFILRFLVRREGLKLSVCGRDPIERLPVPKELPKAMAKYFSDARIAHHAGQTLAGLFLLRVFVEQYWKTIPAVQKLLSEDSRTTGEQQGDAYQSTLPNDFKDRFPSLKEIYGKLSEAIHAANADAELFETSCGMIVKHFTARKLFELS